MDSSRAGRQRSWLSSTWPLLPLILYLAWGWRGQSLTHSVPTYGDVIEITWLLSWYEEALRTGQNPALFPLAFYPTGWHVGTIGHGPLLLLMLLPLQWLGGPAFAYNISVLLTFILAYVGAYLLARRFVAPLPGVVVALLLTFWGFRWFQTIGHLNILLGSALLPWILWSLERAVEPGAARGRWLLLAAIFWTISNLGTLYFVWIDALAVAGWLAGRALARSLSWRRVCLLFLGTSAVALLLSAPALYWTWRASGQVGAEFYGLEDVLFWGASVNSLLLPYINHPWLGHFARTVYKGLPYEQGAVNFGLFASLVAIGGLLLLRRQRQWFPAFTLALLGVTLSLGLVLKWDGEPVRVEWTGPLNSALWSIGHTTKPLLFPGNAPPAPFDEAAPLPGMLLTTVVPFLERARVFARFALVGAIGLYLLAGAVLNAIRCRWLQGALALVLAVEVLPPPLPSLPFPGESHPAFEWLGAQALPGQSVVDIVAAHPYTPVLMNLGEAVWATRFHGKATVAGASSVWPAENSFLFEWLSTHEHAFLHPALAPLLRFYDVRYLLLHMRGEMEQGLLAEARENEQLELVNCFAPSTGQGPWPYDICVLELLPPQNPELNLVLKEGWSSQEAWGVWSESRQAEAFWVTTGARDQILSYEIFPNCIEGQPQHVALLVNGQPVVEQGWDDCDAVSGQVTLPTSLLERGASTLEVRSAFAMPATGASDPRTLAVGFTRLRIDDAP